MSTSATKSRKLNRLGLFRPRRPSDTARKRILTLFGTRPEAIKLAPVIKALEAHKSTFQTINITSGQHTDLLYPFAKLLGIRIDLDLQVMLPNQTPNLVCARVLAAMDPILDEIKPEMILVQGDTTTALAGALAGFHTEIPVGHVEAGLRSGSLDSPFPEEMNRRMISRLATYHFAATTRNRRTLISEGVEKDRIFVTGNPIIDSLNSIINSKTPRSTSLEELVRRTRGFKRLVLTTHRRERLGELMMENLVALRHFVDSHDDIALIFPVHPNPSVVNAARVALSHHSRIHLIDPLGYEDFIALLSEAWLIVSDSGGVQEEAPTLGKPLLILRENTERPEALDSGVARLIGSRPSALGDMLEEAYLKGSWASHVEPSKNPFGTGNSGQQIAGIISELLGAREACQTRVANS